MKSPLSPIEKIKHGSIVALFSLVAGLATWWLLLRPVLSGQVVLDGKGGRVVYVFSESPVWFCLALTLEGGLVAALWWGTWVRYDLSFRAASPGEKGKPDDDEGPSSH